ncbi:tweek [Carabus blaptoides fortunei]
MCTVIISSASSEEWPSGDVYENSKHYVTVVHSHYITSLVGWLAGDASGFVINLTIILNHEKCLIDGGARGNEEPDVTDKCVMLLRTDALLKPAQTQYKQTGAGSKTTPGREPAVPVNSPKGPVNVDTPLALVTVVSAGIESVLTSPSPPSGTPHTYTHPTLDYIPYCIYSTTLETQQKGLQPTQNPSSSRPSVVFPILSTTNPFANSRQHMVNMAVSAIHTRTHIMPLGIESTITTTRRTPHLPAAVVLSGRDAPTDGGCGSPRCIQSLDSLGSNLSLVGSMDQMRIDIVVSEHGKGVRCKGSSNTTSTKTGTSPHQTLHLDISCEDESPAFVCERVSIVLEVEKKAEMTADDMIRTSTALNFSIGVRYISQQVNMPLLRLLHQISNMYQNVKDTQNELREQRPDLCRTNLKRINKPLTLKVSDPRSILSQNKKVISPSASVRSRPQSFAQKLRSTGKSVKGYMNLSEGVSTPMFTGSPSVSGGLTVGSDKTVYQLLDLYATMPETKTITHRFSMAADISEHFKGKRKYDILAEVKSIEAVELQNSSTPLPPKELGVVAGERTRLVVFGVARIHRTRLLATLTALKLEAEITNLHSSLKWRKKS